MAGTVIAALAADTAGSVEHPELEGPKRQSMAEHYFHENSNCM